jgi:rhomboid family GlyGly-CTERM serine protease
MRLNTFPIAHQHSLIVLIVSIITTIIFGVEYTIGESVTQTLVYQRDLIVQGDYYRVFTAHLLHTNGAHLLLNLAALIMLWALHGRFYSIANYVAVFLFCSLTTSLGIFYYDPTLIEYVGLSGVLHGIFVFGALMDIRAKDKTGYLLLLGIILKISHEQIYGASSDVSDLIEASVAVNAHLCGAVGGFVFAIIYSIKYRKALMPFI